MAADDPTRQGLADIIKRLRLLCCPRYPDGKELTRASTYGRGRYML